MKKPERENLGWETKRADKITSYENYQIGYNKACDKWERYHEWNIKEYERIAQEASSSEIEMAKKLDKSPSTEDIEDILFDIIKIEFVAIPDIAKAIVEAQLKKRGGE